MVNKKGFIKTIFSEGNVITIIGKMGSGKTDKACLFIEKAVEKGYHCHTNINFFKKQEIDKAIGLGILREGIQYIEKPYQIHIVTKISELILNLFRYRPNIVLLDEAGLFVSSTEATSKRVRIIKQLTYLIRHLNSSIVFICQSKKSLVPEIREKLVTYQIQIQKKSQDNRVMVMSKPDIFRDVLGEEYIDFSIIDIRQNLPSSKLPYDSKFLPAFKIDIDLDLILNSIAGLNSIGILERGEEIIKNILKKQDKFQNFLTITEYADKHSVHPDTVRRWIKNNEIKYEKTKGGHYRIKV
jgi:excisionase family DNA binding protein